jgi:autotransporter-associated beta strand protein
LTLSGVLAGTGASLILDRLGTLTLTAANTRTGDVYIYAGTLKLSGAGELGA